MGLFSSTTAPVARNINIELDWIRDVPRRELGILHHALRLCAQHPGVYGEQKVELEALADKLWNESVRRPD